MIRITFLGTSAARPTPGRNVSSLAVQRGGDRLLFDCGEGTQRQMMRYGTGFGVNHVFITHTHADHFLGLSGLLRTMALEGRDDPIFIHGPPASSGQLRLASELGAGRAGFPVRIEECPPGKGWRGEGYRIEAFEVAHGREAVGWALIEDDRLGRFDVERARSEGVPEGPVFGRLHRGEDVEVDGRLFRAIDFVGRPRPGRTVVYTGDSRPVRSTVEMARGADLLVHEATFTSDEADRARATYHSTAREAAEVAARARVQRLLLTHVSARYSDNAGPLRDEARKIFPKARVAYDGLVVEIPLAGDDGGALSRHVSGTGGG